MPSPYFPLDDLYRVFWLVGERFDADFDVDVAGVTL